MRVLRIAPAAGRLFGESDAAEGAEPVVVLGLGFWQRRFAADPAAIGRMLVLDDVPRVSPLAERLTATARPALTLILPRRCAPSDGQALAMYNVHL